jgi:hypothetical protein
LITASKASVACSRALALVRPQLGQCVVAAGHQALAGIVWRGDLGQVALIEQAQLQMALLDQRSDRDALERGDPVNPSLAAKLVDGLLRDHAAVTHHHHLRQAEALAHALHGGQECQAVGGIALEHRDGHRAAARVGEQAVVDLQRAGPAIAAVAPLGQWAATALEVTR